jgi:uncharacterized protein
MWALPIRRAQGRNSMNVVVPIRDFASGAEPQGNAALSLGTEREIWEDRRRMMERRGRFVGPDGSLPPWRSALFGHGLQIFGWATRLLGLYALGKRNAGAPRLIELTYSFADLPAAFDGYRILHVSDTHFDYLPELAQAARRMLDGVEVDVLALTGDVHGHYRRPIAQSVAPLADMLSSVSVRDRRYAILGNHDPADMAEGLERLGFTVLLNDSHVVERRGQRVVITGLDDVHHFYTPAADQAFVTAPPGFRIALVHSGEMADRASAAGYSLYLCGHTHGGQIRLPNGRPIFTRLRRCEFAADGEWRHGGMIGYTSRGLGVSGVPLRYNCQGEMAIITLRRR